MIRQETFEQVNKEVTLTLEVECPECGEVHSVEVSTELDAELGVGEV